MYRTRFCPFCVRAESLLLKKNAQLTQIDVAGDWEKRDWLRQVTGQATVPQIFINGEPIGGCDELYALEREGRLDELLSEDPSVA
jgi:glutaredoxin 3